tara:strand:+ start:257 stop:1948 length:1692 start_codon:yes stop_codon:yes gene_type:complete
MAESFKNRVDALTGFAGTEDDALSDWLADGAKEIINVLPAELLQYCSGATRLDGDPSSLPISTDTDMGKVLHVTHSNGTRQLPCRLIPAAYASLASDATSLTYYGTDSDPVYWITGTRNSNDTTSTATILEVFPTPTSAKTAYVHHVTYPAVLHSWTGIDNFPDNAEYLVALYAAIKAIHALMNNKNAALSDLSLTPVPPDVPSIGTSAVSFGTAAPAYNGGSVVGFGSLLKSLANLSVSAVPPDTPTINTVSYTDFTNVSFSGETFSVTEVSFSTTAPSYTPPNITAASGTQPLTEMEAITGGQVGNDADFIDFEMWFSALGEMIEDDEDIELASAQIEKINTYVGAYNISMQNELNNFNEDVALYQAQLQISLQNANMAIQEKVQEAQLAQQATSTTKQFLQQQELQKAIKVMEGIIQTNNVNLSKYQAETAVYQAEVNAQIQEYQVSTSLALQQHSQSMQDNLNLFNDANVEYQAQLQVSLANANFDNEEDARKFQKYQGEVAAYQAEVNAAVQEYSNTLQKKTLDYGWLQNQYAQLKSDYAMGLSILKTGNLPTEGGTS